MKHPLPEVKVLNHCPASWKKMRGNDRVRFCETCQKRVYNLSNMTAEQAFQVLYDCEGTPCVRFRQRPDGSIVTADCPLPDRLKLWTRSILVGIATTLLGWLGYAGFRSLTEPRYTTGEVASLPNGQEYLTGKVAITSPQNQLGPSDADNP